MRDVYSVIYSPEALADLKEIYAHIAFTLAAPDAANSQVSRIRQKIRTLNILPLRHMKVDWQPWKDMGMHKMPVDNFVVYYIADATDFIVTIIRIFYSGRNVGNIMDDEIK